MWCWKCFLESILFIASRHINRVDITWEFSRHEFDGHSKTRVEVGSRSQDGRYMFAASCTGQDPSPFIVMNKHPKGTIQHKAHLDIILVLIATSVLYLGTREFWGQKMVQWSETGLLCRMRWHCRSRFQQKQKIYLEKFLGIENFPDDHAFYNCSRTCSQ